MNLFAFSLSDLLNFDKAVSNDMTMGQKLENILTTAVGGYVLVFAILALIWGLLELFSVFFSKKKEKPKNEAAIISEPTITETVKEEATDEAELVAAITAAITAYRSTEEASGTAFKVVSFRKK